MNQPIFTLTLTNDQYDHVKNFLFLGDRQEIRTVLLLCGQRNGDRRHRILARKIYTIKQAGPEKPSSLILWPEDVLEEVLKKAHTENLVIVRIHAQSTDSGALHENEDIHDPALWKIIHGKAKSEIIYGSVTMFPSGQMVGRVIRSDGLFESIKSINIIGDDLHFWYSEPVSSRTPNYVASHKQIFGQGTVERLSRLSVAVIGCSGTGSPVIEQLVRLGVGEIVLVDEDRIEEKNINRILNSKLLDAIEGRFKVDILADAIRRIGLNTNVIPVHQNLWNPNVVGTVAQCDIVFGCMDTVDGRFLLNTLATYYLLPYIDIGVRLVAVPNGLHKGCIREVCGTIHYLQPGKSSLISRGLFNMKDVANAGLRRNDPHAFKQQLNDGYISGVFEERPAVISVNMFAASLAVNEFLARLHPYREEPNEQYSSVTFSLSSMDFFYESENNICELLEPLIGTGDTEPYLNLHELAKRRDS